MQTKPCTGPKQLAKIHSDFLRNKKSTKFPIAVERIHGKNKELDLEEYEHEKKLLVHWAGWNRIVPVYTLKNL